MKITALAPWFGSNRTLAVNVGASLKGCRWVGVPFAGGMCELAHIDARTVVVGDLHKQIINLANVLRHDKWGPQCIRALRRIPFHECTLADAQAWISSLHWWKHPFDFDPPCNPRAAVEYFVCAWMGRNGTAGTARELNSGLSVRWDAGGGDSATRFRNATESLREWRDIFTRCTFVVRDVFDFLTDVKDIDGHGLYLDPPFPEVGDKYKHQFSRLNHCQLAEQLTAYDRCRVVCRFYDHPLIRELYPESAWTWHHFEGRRQTNTVGPEVLLVRNGA